MTNEPNPPEYSPWDEPKLPPERAVLELDEPPLARIKRGPVMAIAAGVVVLLIGSVVYAVANRTKHVRAEPELKQRPYGTQVAGVPPGIQQLELATTPAKPDDGADVANTLPIQKPVPPIDYADQQAEKYFAAVPMHSEPSHSYQPHEPAAYEPQHEPKADCCQGDDLPSMQMGDGKERQGAASGSGNAPSQAISGVGQQVAALGQARQQMDQLHKLLEQAQGGEQSGDADERKEAFNARKGIETLGSDEDDLAECDLSAGTAIHGSVMVATNSDLPSGNTVTIKVDKTVYCGADMQHVAIPQGSKFVGEVNHAVSYGDERAQLCMKQLERPPSAGHPTGSRKALGCMIVADITGASGMPADVDNHWDKVIVGSLLSAILSIGVTVPSGSQTGFAPTLAQNAAHNAGNSLNQAGQRVVSRELQRKPTLTTQMLENVNVMFTSNVQLEPWVARR